MASKKNSKSGKGGTKQTGNTGKRPAKGKKIVSLAQYEADAAGGDERADDVAATVAAVDNGSLAEGVVIPTAGGKKREAKGRPLTHGVKGPRRSLVNAAIIVLADAGEPLNAKSIVERATAAGLYEPGDGKTPEASLYSAMLRDAKARFQKADRGLWTLTDAGKAEIEAIRQTFTAK